MKSLAEHLGVVDPKTPDTPSKPRSARLTIKAFCQGIIDSDEYRQSILRRIYLDSLPAQIETLFYHYAGGKPVEHIEIKDVSDDVDEMSVEQCEAEARRLLEVAQELRRQQPDDDPVDGTAHTTRVH